MSQNREPGSAAGRGQLRSDLVSGLAIVLVSGGLYGFLAATSPAAEGHHPVESPYYDFVGFPASLLIALLIGIVRPSRRWWLVGPGLEAGAQAIVSSIVYSRSGGDAGQDLFGYFLAFLLYVAIYWAGRLIFRSPSSARH